MPKILFSNIDISLEFFSLYHHLVPLSILEQPHHWALCPFLEGSVSGGSYETLLHKVTRPGQIAVTYLSFLMMWSLWKVGHKMKRHLLSSQKMLHKLTWRKTRYSKSNSILLASYQLSIVLFSCAGMRGIQGFKQTERSLQVSNSSKEFQNDCLRTRQVSEPTESGCWVPRWTVGYMGQFSPYQVVVTKGRVFKLRY